MDYLDQVMDVVDSQQPTQDRTKKGLPWLKSFSFEVGNFPIRFVSDETKCPRGFHPHCVHEVQMKPLPNRKLTREERETYYNQILCTLSTHGTVPYDTGLVYPRTLPNGEAHPRAGQPIMGSKLAKPCPVCDVYADYQQTFGEWEGEPGKSKFKGIPETVLSEGIQGALEDMRQGTCLRYLFPVLVRAKVTKNKDDYEAYVEGNDLFLAILGLQPGKYGSDEAMLKLINENRRGRPNFFSRSEGNWVSYQRAKRGAKMECEDASPLRDKELELLKKYPDVTQYGKGVDGIPNSNKTMDYEQAMYSFEDCWWLKSTKRAHSDYNLENIPMGLV